MYILSVVTDRICLLDPPPQGFSYENHPHAVYSILEDYVQRARNSRGGPSEESIERTEGSSEPRPGEREWEYNELALGCLWCRKNFP